MKLLKTISFYLVISVVSTLVTNHLQSDFIFTYLQENIISLQITLLAINTATLGLIASKIQDISSTHKIDFSPTIREMKLSLKEQIILIITSIVTLILQKSKVIDLHCQEFIGNTLLLAVLIYSLNILWDTGKAVFIIIEEIHKIHNKD